MKAQRRTRCRSCTRTTPSCTRPSRKATPNDGVLAQDFVRFAVESGVLRFGEFKTKAGRMSPYFFNAGLFDDGAKLGRLAEFYAKALLASGIEFDMIFGPGPCAGRSANAMEERFLSRNGQG